MVIIKGILIAVELIVSMLLILIILVQPSKSGGGLGGAAFGGGGMGEQLFGARAGNVLTKGTVMFAIIFLVNTLVLAKIYSGANGTARVRNPAPSAVSEPVAPAQGLPEAPEAPADLTLPEPVVDVVTEEGPLEVVTPVVDDVVAPAVSTEAPADAAPAAP